MKHHFPLMTALALAGLRLCAQAGTGVVDLTSLANYAAQPKPVYINKNNTPANNPITDKGATLGRVLFYDKRLSRTDTVSCASCHQQAHGFSDGATASAGVAGTTGRHAMRLINERFADEVHFFWDERALTLEAQTSQPIQNHVEMGFSGTSGDPALSALVTKLSAIDEYRVLFAMTFGDATITETRLQFALAQFVRSIQSFDSRYDTGRAAAGNDAAPFANFTASENNGKQLFINPPGPNGAGCAGCHRPPAFDILPNSLNNGVITQIGGGTDLTNTRSPSLRDLLGPGGVSNGAFMHDGSFTTLAQVINHYNAIPALNANLDPKLQPNGRTQRLNLTQTQKDDLAAFLATLTGTAVYTDARWSDPFTAQGTLSLVVLPGSNIAITDKGNGTATIACKAAPALPYLLQSSPDLANWTTVATVTSDAAGAFSQTVPMSGTAFYRYAYTPPAITGAIAGRPASLSTALASSTATTTPTSTAAASVARSRAYRLAATAARRKR